MVKLLRSDFYRLFKSKSFYICTLIAMVLVSASAFLMDWSYQMLSQSPETSAQAASVAGTMFQNGISYGLMMFMGGNSLLYMAIFISIFITSEFSYGTMKNTVSKGFSKFRIYLSKLITMIAATYILVFMIFIVATVTATIISGDIGTFTGAYVGQIFVMMGVELLLHAALASIFVIISNTVRNIGGAIAINIIGVISFGPLIYQALEMLFKNKIRFSQYGIQNNMSIFALNIAPPAEDILRAAIVGIVFLVVSTAAGIFAFKNMDVK